MEASMQDLHGGLVHETQFSTSSSFISIYLLAYFMANDRPYKWSKVHKRSSVSHRTNKGEYDIACHKMAVQMQFCLIS